MRARAAAIAAVGGVILAAVLGALPGAWPFALAGVGLATFALGCAGMFYRLREELPDHPLLGPPRIGVGPPHWNLYARVWFGRRPTSVIRLIDVHWKRHGMDLWSAMATIGAAIIAIVVTMRWLT